MIKMPTPNIFLGNTFEEPEMLPAWEDNEIDLDRLGQLSTEIKEITALYNIGVAVGSSLDLKKVIWALYRESSRLLDTSNFALIIYDNHLKALNFTLVFDQGQRMSPLSIKLSRRHELTGRVLINQAPVLVHDLLETQKGHNFTTYWTGHPFL